jgi:hypothetical protein
VSLIREPSDWQHPDRDRAVSTGTHRKVVRRAAHRIGHGALTCPGCDLPLLPVRVTLTERIGCPFCGRVEPAGRFVRLGESDVRGNAVELIARVSL